MEGETVPEFAVENKNTFVPYMGQKRLLLRYHPNWCPKTPTRFHVPSYVTLRFNGRGPVGNY